MSFIYVSLSFSLSLSRPPPLSPLSLLSLENSMKNVRIAKYLISRRKRIVTLEKEEDYMIYLPISLSLFRYYIYVYLIIDRVPSREFFCPFSSLSLSSLENFVSGKFNEKFGIFNFRKERNSYNSKRRIVGFIYVYLSLSFFLFRYYIYVYLIIDRVPSREFFSPPPSLLLSLENSMENIGIDVSLQLKEEEEKIM